MNTLLVGFGHLSDRDFGDTAGSIALALINPPGIDFFPVTIPLAATYGVLLTAFLAALNGDGTPSNVESRKATRHTPTEQLQCLANNLETQANGDAVQRRRSGGRPLSAGAPRRPPGFPH